LGSAKLIENPETNKINSNVHNLDIVVHASLGLASGSSAAFFAVLATRLGASPWLLALISSSPYLTNLLAPFWIREAKRFGTHYLIFSSLLIASIVLLALSFARSALSFSLLVLFYYIFYGISEPMYVALAEIIYPEHTGKYLGKVQSIFNAVHGISNIVGGWLLHVWGIFITLSIAALSTVVGAFSYLPFPNLKSTDSEENATPWKIFREDELVRKFTLVFMVAGTGMVMMLPAMPLIEVNRIKLSNLQIGFLLGTNSIALILFTRLWGSINESPRYLSTTFRLGMLAITLMAILYAVSKSFYILLIANFLCGIGGSAISVGWQLFAINISDYNTGDLAALHLLTCGIRGLFAPAFGAFLIAIKNPALAMWVSGILVLAGSFLLPSNKEVLVKAGYNDDYEDNKA
jgi:predicted MFS family arabinose efflux permease